MNILQEGAKVTGQFSVLILGYGEMGRAMEKLLAKSQILHIWDKYPQDGFESVALEDMAPIADIIIFCLPVNPHREVAERVSPLLKDSCLCLSIAKGLDESGQTAAQIFSDVFLSHQYALLYGPMISEEICAGRYAFAQVGCENKNIYNKVDALFWGTNLFLEQSSDIVGISWSVILKNVYAMLFGMADELKLGDNMRGYLAVAALRELDQIVRQMGGKEGCSYHLAGLGDLITTATSEDSHHHELGRRLARGETQEISGEGVHTLEMVIHHEIFDVRSYPLIRLTNEIIKNPNDVKSKIYEYLKQLYL